MSGWDPNDKGIEIESGHGLAPTLLPLLELGINHNWKACPGLGDSCGFHNPLYNWVPLLIEVRDYDSREYRFDTRVKDKVHYSSLQDQCPNTTTSPATTFSPYSGYRVKSSPPSCYVRIQS